MSVRWYSLVGSARLPLDLMGETEGSAKSLMSAVEVATDINPDSLMTYTAYIRRPFILPQPRAPTYAFDKETMTEGEIRLWMREP